MGLVVPRLTVPILVMLLLALGGAPAYADDYDFSVSPNPPNRDQVTTFSLVTSSGKDVTVAWDLDGEEGFEASGPTATHVYTVAGDVTARMRVTEPDGKKSTV